MRSVARPASALVRRPIAATAALIALLAVGTPAFAAPTENVIFLGRLDEHSGYSDIWGYTAPGGAEYALLGTLTGFAVINVSDPSQPYETGYFPGATSDWRDIKTYDHYAYVVNETSGGMAIIDLSDPENPTLAGTYTAGGLSHAHNLFIDTTTARAYVFGMTNSSGFLLLDLTNPTAPVEVTRWDLMYVHDGMVQNDRLYACAIYDPSLRVLDVSNPLAITELGIASGYPDAFTHNAWVTPDDAYVITTDETSSSSCRMWDLSTLPTLAQTDSYRPGGIPHNAHIEGNLAFISYYTIGVKILDVSDPQQLVEVASYDTWPDDDASNYNGCWGVYPFFETSPDLIVASDIQNGLYVLEYRGPLGTLTGSVTDATSPKTAIAGATVELLPDGLSTTSDAGGRYDIQDVAGDYDLRVSAFGYETVTVPATITEGVTTTVDVVMTPLASGAVSGTVTASGGGPIQDARVEVLGTPLTALTDGAGAYAFSNVPTGAYTVRASAFGRTPMQASVIVSTGGSLPVDFPLNAASVVLDFEASSPGWSVSGNAARGTWERADPQGTYSGGTPIQPENDHTPAPGTLCWVTDASAGSGPGNWDVDDGATILTTPLYSTATMTDPHVSYHRWYSTGVGNPNTDPFLVAVSTDAGSTWPVLLENTDVTTNAWVEIDLALNAFVSPTSLLRFRFTAQDTGAGSLIEAALDDFMIYDGFDVAPSTSVTLPTDSPRGLTLGLARPNPFMGESRTEFVLGRAGRVTASIHDAAGRRVATLLARDLDAGPHTVVWSGRAGSGSRSPAGVYFLRVETSDVTRTRKIVLLR